LNVLESAEAVPVGVSEPEQAIETSESGPEPEIIAEVQQEISDTMPEESDQAIKVTEVATKENIEPAIPEQGLETPEAVTAEITVQKESSSEEPVKEELHREALSLEETHQQEPDQEEPLLQELPSEEQNAEDTSLKTRDELIAEIEARLGELEKEDLLELEEGDEITVDPIPGKVSAEIAEPEDISIDSVEGESPEVSIPQTEETSGTVKPLKQLSPNDLIDRFIQTSPRIERMVPGEVPLLMDLTERKPEEHTPFITETLARIYINQGYYTRAINIYEKLTLQFPEKSAYFASRIEKIKELIK
jgi:hypothetical protein